MSEPLLEYLDDRLDAAWMPFGPPVPSDGGGEQTIRVAQHYGAFELEYAALRRSVGVVHAPWRAALRLEGPDAAEFLHRICTQDVLSMAPDQVRPALLLDARGHILAEFLVHRDAEGCTAWVDRFDLEMLRTELDRRLFAEQVELRTPASDAFLLAGPAAASALAQACEAVRHDPQDDSADHDDGPGPLSPDRAAHRVIGGVPVTLLEQADGGDEPLHWVGVIAADTDASLRVMRALLDAAGLDPDRPHAEPGEADAQRRRQTLRGTASGWDAFNTWRVETGRAMFHLDYGTDSLPAEAHRVASHISLTKGCFAGQEAVARMHNLGHPKKLVVRLDLDRGTPPATGADVTVGGKVVGAVTSSAASPLRGQSPVALATVRWGQHEPETELEVGGVRAVVRTMPD